MKEMAGWRAVLFSVACVVFLLTFADLGYAINDVVLYRA